MSAPTAPAAPSPRVRTEPARRLTPSPGGGRTWRVVVTVIAAMVMSVALLALAGMALTSWAVNRSFQEVAATHDLGSPDSLTLTSRVADVRVATSPEVDEVTLALVEPGSFSVPDPDRTARARVSVEDGADGPQVTVSQPNVNRFGGLLDDHRDVLLLVPEGHRMALDVRSDVGDIDAAGAFTSVTIGSDVGDVSLSSIDAPDGITVRTDVGQVSLTPAAPVPGGIDISSTLGDVDLALPVDAEGPVTVHSDIGEVDIAAPGTTRREVHARSDVGTVDVDPALMSGDGEPAGTLTVTTSVGDISVSR